MRVVHVDSAYEWRGSQNQVLLGAEGMGRRGDQVQLACRRAGLLEIRALNAGIGVWPLSFNGDLSPFAIWGLARRLRAFRPEVVHAHDPHATAVALVAAAMAGRPPVVASRRVHLGLNGLFSRRKYAACARVLAVSRAVEERLVGDGVERSQVRVVHEGVLDRPARYGGREVLEALGVPPRAPVIGNVAALEEHKDHATLLEAMPAVLAAVPEARLLIVGSGRLRARLEQHASRLGLGQRCVFTGFRSDLDRLTPAFTVACLTSRTEGLGTTLLDAMCFERAIVATNTGGIPEVVSDGETGRLVPVGNAPRLADALVGLLSNAPRRAEMGRAGRRVFLRRFAAPRMVEATRDVYAEVCRPFRAPKPVRVDHGFGLTGGRKLMRPLDVARPPSRASGDGRH
jgi:glycosyltransferase involved in cell wall biosynthesis